MHSDRILILRNGSLGDTIIALPAFRLIAEAFPSSQRLVLTAQSAESRAVQLEAILTGTGYVHGYLTYDGSAPPWEKYREVRGHLRNLRPKITISLVEPRSALTTLRDALFLAVCGARWVRGLPLRRDQRRNRWLPLIGRYEYESDRLLRVMSETMGLVSVNSSYCDLLKLNEVEEAEASVLLSDWPGRGRFIVASLGCRVPLKDWGEDRWKAVISQVADQFPELGLVFVGTKDDWAQAHRLGKAWTGPVLNLSGQTAPRISASIMRQALVYIGPDGGSMHLAAAVGTPCVAVFTARSPKGVWFPYGALHRVHYRDLPCSGCLLDECHAFQRACITAITVEEVRDSVFSLLNHGLSSNTV